MLGHYLLTLTPEQEDRVLTGKMRPGAYELDGEGPGTGPCLVGTVCGSRAAAEDGGTQWKDYNCVEWSYDGLCGRFGTPRINAVIRNRILANQARRVLTSQTAMSATERAPR